MKKRRGNAEKAGIDSRTGNILVTITYFLASILYLNVLESSLVTNIIGVAMVIAFAYGVVCVYKDKKFLF